MEPPRPLHHLRFCIFPPLTVSDNQKAVALGEPGPNVSWQALLCKQRRFREQLSRRVFIVWLRFQREATTSVGRLEEHRGMEGTGGGGSHS